MRDKITIENVCYKKGIKLKKWQKEAANAFLVKVFPYRKAAAGKTFLMKELSAFISSYGSEFELKGSK